MSMEQIACKLLSDTTCASDKFTTETDSHMPRLVTVLLESVEIIDPYLKDCVTKERDEKFRLLRELHVALSDPK